MMIKRILTICAAVAAGAAVIPFAQAQQAYPVPPGTYSPVPQPYPAGSAPNFDSLDDDDAPGAAPLPPPGPGQGYGRAPVMSPDDPRYGRPLYSDRDMPSGPVTSPDDPRYGRPAGPPAVVYGDRAAPDQQAYVDPNTPRPPEGMTGQPNVTGAVPPPAGPDGRPMTVAALPPEEQPESGPAQLPPNLRRQEVDFATKEPAGTIVVDTPNTYLYYVLGGGKAIRYGVRVGRDGFTWTGVQKITRKKEWPDWYPPSEMIDRQPYLPRFMAGGPGNPLGARAMYLGNTVYRIHGTNQPSTIGKFVSSGCIGMLNEDVSDLFDHVKVGTRVVVLPGNPPAATATASAQPVPGQMSSGPVPGTQQPTAVPPLPAPVTVR
jgi:lipoprotein-anchoring transpeptidase ErfK/SrfK